MIPMSSMHTSSNNTQPGTQELRDAALAQEFANNVGRRAFILTFPFPFLFIGKIVKVESDFVFLLTETSQVSEFEGLVARININEIDVFFIEQATGPKIPVINDRHPSTAFHSPPFGSDTDDEYEE